MWVLLLFLAALAGVVSFGALVDAHRYGSVLGERLFLLSLVMASVLVGAALQWGLG